MSEGIQIQDSFLAYGKPHLFTARHYLTLSQDECEKYGVRDGDFLIGMEFEDNSSQFTIFRDEDESLQWTTNASTIIIDKESVEVIGSIIDEHCF